MEYKKILFGVMLLLMITAVSAKTVEERLTELELKVGVLENWKNKVEAFITGLNAYLGPHGLTLCEAVKICQGDIVCYENSDCGIDTTLENTCMGDKVMTQEEIHTCILPGTQESRCFVHIGMNTVETCENGCENAMCLEPNGEEEELEPVYVPNQKLIFDYDNDGKMDCFEYKSFFRSYYNRYPIVLGLTPEGHEIHKYGTTDVIVKDSNNPIFKPVECETSGTVKPVVSPA